MLYPQEMSKIELVLSESHIIQVMEVLGAAGNFQQIDASYLTTEYKVGEPASQDWANKASTFAALERRLGTLMETLNIDDGGLPNHVLRPITNERMIFNLVDQIEEEVNALLGKMDTERTRIDQLRSFIRLLEPLAEVDIEMDSLKNLDYIFLILGVGPTQGLDRLRTSLSRIPFEMLVLDEHENQAVILLAGPRQNADVLERAARSAFINPLEIPAGYHGTALQMTRAMSEDLEKLEKQIAGQEGAMDDLRQEREKQLQHMLWQVRKSHMISSAINRFGKLRYTYLVVGWAPTNQVELLHSQLREISEDILFEATPFERNENGQQPPSSLQNKGFFKAFQSLVTIYGQPKYNELDPSILLAITFPLLFGAMFGDVGQGALLAILGGLLASKKIKSLSSASSLGVVLAACGVSATVFGFLYGSFFGLEDILQPIWIRPMDNIMQILMFAIGGGVLLLTFAFFLSMFNDLKNKNWVHLVFSNHGVSGFLLFIAILGLGGSFLAPTIIAQSTPFLVLALFSSILIMVAEPVDRLIHKRKPIIQENIIMFAIQAFFEVFESLISIFSNILSYVRVGAFAVAHVGLSAVIFILAEMVSPAKGIAYWVVVALGNLFIIGFEGMIVGIQTLRLEYYEFFSKFFSGGGNPFHPIKLDRS